MATYVFDDLKGLPVVSNAAAREIGRVKEVLFNPAANALYGLVVTPAEKDGPPLLIPLRGIRSIGKTRLPSRASTSPSLSKTTLKRKRSPLLTGTAAVWMS